MIIELEYRINNPVLTLQCVCKRVSQSVCQISEMATCRGKPGQVMFCRKDTYSYCSYTQRSSFVPPSCSTWSTGCTEVLHCGTHITSFTLDNVASKEHDSEKGVLISWTSVKIRQQI